MITIVGVGALGSHVALFLRNEATLQVVDFDRIEQKNIQAQFHTKMSLGKNKAMAMKQSFQGLFGVKIDSICNKLVPDNRISVLAGSDLIIDCTDNIAARKVIIDSAKEMGNRPCLHGSLSAAGDFAQVIWTEHFTPDAESGDGATCENGEHLPFFATAAAHLALEAQLFLRTGKKRSFQITPSGIIRVA